MCNIGREHYEKHFCEFLFDLASVVHEELSYKYITIFCSGSYYVSGSSDHLIRRSKLLYSVLMKGIISNITLKMIL